MTQPLPKEESWRLFFALWPSANLAGQLAAWAQQAGAECGGRIMRTDGLHLTLAFLGDVPVARLAELRTIADGIAADAFSLTLDQAGWWRHNRIVWAAPGHLPEAASRLAAGLRIALSAAGFVVSGPEWSPHVTLLRKAERAWSGKLLPLDWPVQDFVLAHSPRTAGSGAYRCIGRWPLRPPGAAH